MANGLVLLSTRPPGNTAVLADAIAEGARSVRFTEVDVRRLDDLAPESVIGAQPEWQASRDRLRGQYRTLADPTEIVDYDALVLGAPTRHGVMAAELTLLLETLGPLGMQGALADRVGAAFTSVQTAHGGHELTLQSIMTPMCNLGMILAPPGYTDPVMLRGGSPYGATATTSATCPTEARPRAAATRAPASPASRLGRHAKGQRRGTRTRTGTRTARGRASHHH